ncbi:MAG UNVERIFIED_CONTAM: hypothetical protein LVR18_38445 [Planctomycetaceae bacterium]
MSIARPTPPGTRRPMVSRADLLLLLSRGWSDAGGDSSVVSGESELLAQQLQLGIGPAVLVPPDPDFSASQLPNPEQEQQREQQTASGLRRLLRITAVESAATEAPDAPVYWKWTAPPPAAQSPGCWRSGRSFGSACGDCLASRIRVVRWTCSV